MFKGFSQKGLDFFYELEVNNNKLWFEANKSVYEQEILAVNRAFVVEMGEHLECLVPTIHAIPKINKSLFKIYRDVRFSKDKTPLKTRSGVLFWQGKGSRTQSSGFYLHYSVYELFIATGIRGFDKEMLSTYRDYIMIDKHREALHTILEELQAKGYSLPTPKYKRIPNMFDKTMSHAYLTLFNSMFVYKQSKPPKAFFTPKIVDSLFKAFDDMLALQQWVYEMTLTRKEEK